MQIISAELPTIEQYIKYKDVIPFSGDAFWLQSNQSNSEFAPIVANSGYFNEKDDNCFVNTLCTSGVRILLTVDGFDEDILNFGRRDVYTKIDDNLYISNKIIDYMWYDPNSSDYKSSIVRDQIQKYVKKYKI